MLELSNWELDANVPADAFGSAKASGAARIAFAHPNATTAPAMKPPPKAAATKAAPAKSQPTKTQ